MAKERDLFAPQVPEEYGGQGLDFRDMLPSFEQVGRSLIGAHARADKINQTDTALAFKDNQLMRFILFPAAHLQS